MVKVHGESVVPEGELLPTQVACPVCRATGDRQEAVALQEGPRVTMRRCGVCEAVSADRFPTDAFLTKLYNPEHYSSHLVADPALAVRCAESILDLVDLNQNEPVEILDYGGHDGSLSRAVTELLLARGHRGAVNATVVDLFVLPSQGTQRFITPEDMVAETRAGKRYNLLLASAVIEHLTNLREVMDAILSAGAEGAFFYARTPYDVPLAKLTGRYKVRWPRHLHDLGPEFWDRFFDTFAVAGTMLRSRPSVVESSLKSDAARTIAAHVLKAPARFEESVLRPLLNHRGHHWPYVGGWEVTIRLR